MYIVFFYIYAGSKIGPSVALFNTVSVLVLIDKIILKKVKQKIKHKKKISHKKNIFFQRLLSLEAESLDLYTF